MTRLEAAAEVRRLEGDIMSAVRAYCDPDPPGFTHTAERSAQLQTDMDEAIAAYRRFLCWEGK